MHFTDPYLHRLRGECLLKREPGNSVPAEEAFQTSIAVAKQQGARSYELLAALSLAKLYHRPAAQPKPAPFSGLPSMAFRRLRKCPKSTMLRRCLSCARMPHKSFHNGRRIAGKLTEVTHNRRVPAQLPRSKLWAEANEPRGTVFQFTLPGAGS